MSREDEKKEVKGSFDLRKTQMIRTQYGWAKIILRMEAFGRIGYRCILLENSFAPGKEILFYDGPIYESS